VAQVIERGFVEGAPAHELIAMVEQTPAADDHLAAAIRSVAYLAASLDPAMLPADALRAHLVVLQWAEPRLAIHHRLYRKTLSRFLVAFWARTLERASFRFTAPRAVQSALATLAQLSPPDDTGRLVQRLIQQLLPALSVRPASGAMRWLARLGEGLSGPEPAGHQPT
jgi:hypothetical protein